MRQVENDTQFLRYMEAGPQRMRIAQTVVAEKVLAGANAKISTTTLAKSMRIWLSLLIRRYMWLNWFKNRDLLGVSFQRFSMVSNWKPLETQTSSFCELDRKIKF